MALPTHLTLEIVTPDRSLAVETVDEVELPGSEGYLGVLPGPRLPSLVALQVGALRFRKGEEETFLSVAFGFAEIGPDRVRILADNRRARRGDRHPARGGRGSNGRASN